MCPSSESPHVMRATPAALMLLSAAALAGCTKTGDIEVTGGSAGITAIRSACPTVGVPAGTGDITLFDPPTSREARAIDVSATISNVRSTCNDAGDDIITGVMFDVRARRVRADAARDVSLPYYVAIVRGGNNVVAKRVGAVALHFDAGQPLAAASGQVSSAVSRSLATIPESVRNQLTRRRKAGEDDAAIDPLAKPDVRAAVLSASFEALVGFQLTDEQLRYNVSR